MNRICIKFAIATSKNILFGKIFLLIPFHSLFAFYVLITQFILWFLGSIPPATFFLILQVVCTNWKNKRQQQLWWGRLTPCRHPRSPPMISSSQSPAKTDKVSLQWVPSISSDIYAAQYQIHRRQPAVLPRVPSSKGSFTFVCNFWF